MPSTAPTLTWNMTNIRVPAVATDPEEVLNTITLCVADATYWQLDATAFTGGTGAGYRIFTPVGGNQPNMQVIVCHSPDDDMILQDVAPAPTPPGRPPGRPAGFPWNDGCARLPPDRAGAHRY